MCGRISGLTSIRMFKLLLHSYSKARQWLDIGTVGQTVEIGLFVVVVFDI